MATCIIDPGFDSEIKDTSKVSDPQVLQLSLFTRHQLALAFLNIQNSYNLPTLRNFSITVIKIRTDSVMQHTKMLRFLGNPKISGLLWKAVN